MQKHKDVALVGTLYDGIDFRGQRVRPRDRWPLIRKSASHPFPHGSVMFRRRVFDQVGGYREACAGWEDLDLFLRMSDKGRIIVLPDSLYYYRHHLDCTRLAFSQERAKCMADIAHRCLSEHRLGRDYTYLLKATEEGSSHGNVVARVLYSRGALRLWSGHSPAILGSLFSRGSIAWNLRTLQILIWAAWGSSTPASFRLFLRCLIRARDWVASRYVEDGRPCEWRFE
jgi:hypothetical protein